MQKYCHPPRSAFYYVVFHGMQFSTGSVYMYKCIYCMYKEVPTGWVLSSSTVLYSMLQEILPSLPLLLNLGFVSLIRCHIVMLKENLPYFHIYYSGKTNCLYIEINIQTTETNLKSNLKKKQWGNNQNLQCPISFESHFRHRPAFLCVAAISIQFRTEWTANGKAEMFFPKLHSACF